MTTVLGSGLSEQIDAAVLDAIVPGVREFVEERRKDLFVTAGDPPVTTFEPTENVRLGAVFLAWRLYKRRETPLGIAGATSETVSGILREDPDIARLLGIGAGGRFVFGASTNSTTVEVV